MALSNFRGLDFLRAANETLGQLGLPGLFGSEGVDVIRNIEWGKKFLWAVSFMEPKPPAPFAGYFPASDIEITDAMVDSFVFDAGQSSYKAPQKSNARQVTITFYDNSNAILLKWMSDWLNLDILNNGKFVSCLLDDHPPVGKRRVSFPQDLRVWPTRKIQFAKLGNDLEPVEGTEQILTIYPEGELMVSGSSASEVVMFTLTFVVVGEVRPEDEGSSSDILQKAKREATRLLGRFT